MDSNELENKHLVELGDSDYEIVDGEPDIIGWEVKNEQGQKIGDVDELLFDMETRKVRYVIVDLDDNELEIDGDKKILIPIGIVDIFSDNEADETEETEENEEEEKTEGIVEENESVVGKDVKGENNFDDDEDEGTVVGDHLTTEDEDESEYEDDEDEIYNPSHDGDVVIVALSTIQISDLPAYEKDNITPETEANIRSVIGGNALGTVEYNKTDFYDHDHFNDNKFYGKPEDSDNLIAEGETTAAASTGIIEPGTAEKDFSTTGFGGTESHLSETTEKDLSDFQLPKTGEEEEGIHGSDPEKPVF